MQFFKILNNRDICDVLDGDSKEKYTMKNGKSVKLCMPYLSLRGLEQLYDYYGLSNSYIALYNSNKKFDRWNYVDNLLRMSVKNDTPKIIFTKLFNKGRFLNEYRNSKYDLNYKEIHIISNIAIVSAVLRINDILYSFRYKLIERNMEFYLSFTDDKCFDSCLENNAKMYINQDDVSNNTKYENPKLTELYNGSNSNNNIDNSNKNNINVINNIKFSNYINVQALGQKIDHNINELSDGLSNTQYKNDVDNTKNSMKHKHFSKAWKILNNIPDDILKANKVFKSTKGIIAICKAIAMLFGL